MPPRVLPVTNPVAAEREMLSAPAAVSSESLSYWNVTVWPPVTASVARRKSASEVRVTVPTTGPPEKAVVRRREGVHDDAGLAPLDRRGLRVRRGDRLRARGLQRHAVREDVHALVSGRERVVGREDRLRIGRSEVDRSGVERRRAVRRARLDANAGDRAGGFRRED